MVGLSKGKEKAETSPLLTCVYQPWTPRLQGSLQLAALIYVHRFLSLEQPTNLRETALSRAKV